MRHTRYPLMYRLCKQLFTKLADAFSVSAMLNYFIVNGKYVEGEKYINRLEGLSNDVKTTLLKAFRSYENSC